MNSWHYTESLPRKLYIACSGGVDSVAAAAILSEWRDVTLLHYNHIDHAAEQEHEIVVKLSKRLNVPLISCDQVIDQGIGNAEAKWRSARYSWFNEFSETVVSAHTLDDAIEWYLITCLRGRGEFMPHRNKNVIRPFLLTDKTRLIEYCQYRNLVWWEDPGNHDPTFSLRSKVRSGLMPAALACEPGLRMMVRRRLLNKINQERKSSISED